MQKMQRNNVLNKGYKSSQFEYNLIAKKKKKTVHDKNNPKTQENSSIFFA